MFRIFHRHALNIGRIIVYDDKPPSSEYSIVTLKSNGGKDVTPNRWFWMLRSPGSVLGGMHDRQTHLASAIGAGQGISSSLSRVTSANETQPESASVRSMSAIRLESTSYTPFSPPIARP